MGREFSGEATWRRSRIVVPVASPAAGQDWSLVVPAGHLYHLISVYAVLVTSATVATRVPHLTFSDGVRVFLDVPPFASQVASLTRRYGWFEAATGDTTGLGISSGLPCLALQAAWQLAQSTEAIDAADQWSSVFVHVIDTTTRDNDVDLSTELPELVQVVNVITP